MSAKRITSRCKPSTFKAPCDSISYHFTEEIIDILRQVNIYHFTEMSVFQQDLLLPLLLYLARILKGGHSTLKNLKPISMCCADILTSKLRYYR